MYDLFGSWPSKKAKRIKHHSTQDSDSKAHTLYLFVETARKNSELTLTMIKKPFYWGIQRPKVWYDLQGRQCAAFARQGRAGTYLGFFFFFYKDLVTETKIGFLSVNEGSYLSTDPQEGVSRKKDSLWRKIAPWWSQWWDSCKVFLLPEST